MQNVARDGEAIGRLPPPLEFVAPRNPTLMDALFPSINFVGRLGVSLAFVGLLVAFGRLTFYLPDNPVPITLQTLGVLLMGGVLGQHWGAFAILSYYFMGMAGVPVFKDGGNGWDYVSATATAGYLIGFVAAVPLVGFLSERGWIRGKALWPMLLGNLFIYVPALLWLHFKDLGWPAEGELFEKAMYVFIPGDLVKLMAAALLVCAGWSYVDYRNRRRRERE